MPDEVEGKLVIMGPDAPAVYEAIAGLAAIGSFRVAHRAVEAISDIYFDSPERALFVAGVALRVRTLDGRELLTVKGEARVHEGVISRQELEVEWSPDGLDEVLETLNQAGVSLGNVAAAREASSARQAMEALGLVAGSSRSNRRSALTLVRESTVAGELDVDAVALTVDGTLVRHFEVECEAGPGGDTGVVRDVLADLTSRYPGLRRWSISKLALGEALEALCAAGRLSPLLEGEGLRATGYDEIEALAAGAL
jgi:inorganic triphosphatase YgiF